MRLTIFKLRSPTKEKKAVTTQRLSQVIDLNLLPLEYRKKSVSDLTALLFLLSLGAASLLYPLNEWNANQGEQLVRMRVEVSAKQQAAKQVTGLENRVKELSTSLTQTSKKVESFRQDYQALSRRLIAWSDVVKEIDKEVAPYKIVLQSVTQQGSLVNVKGIAPDYAAAVSFAGSLLNSGLFSTISFQQIVLDAAPQPAIAAAPAGTRPTPTPPPPPQMVHSFSLLLEVKMGGGR